MTTPTQPPSAPPILDSLPVLQGGATPTGHVGGAGEVGISFGHVLSGLGAEEPLQVGQSSLTTHGLSAIGLGGDHVTIDPETLRFQYTPAQDTPPLSQETTPTTMRKKTVYREQDRFLPLHNVARSMRNGIPQNGKVSKDAKKCMQECVSECISFITSEASDKCIAEKRKTITGDDILFAMATLGFDNYIEPLKLYLQKYREYSRAEKISPGPAPPTMEPNSFPPEEPTPPNMTSNPLAQSFANTTYY